MIDASFTLVIEYRDKTEQELLAILANHKNLSPEYQRVDSRAYAASTILEERKRAKTPSKQPFNLK